MSCSIERSALITKSVSPTSCFTVTSSFHARTSFSAKFWPSSSSAYLPSSLSCPVALILCNQLSWLVADLPVPSSLHLLTCHLSFSTPRDYTLHLSVQFLQIPQSRGLS